ncbi:EAL domain-containing protein [Magnetospirillum sulfuroxidans]|uniref:EAL domain-containing protein n=1 Tax=Magnetospirillum sulfuroxidans TaxID=611300 RepID=A0ABS5I9L6_9PROT|nr:EAL domain-containing protein [Magnetospirillum sulfuroxidans]MBR9971107.1 EAL domain-containing protein [Magnetospirillum sulfuroxidans]
MRVTEIERAFLHELHAIKKDPLGKRVIHFCVSAVPTLPDATRRLESVKHYITKSFSRSPYCKVFPVHNGDLFVAYSHVTVSEVLGVCAKVEKLFLDDEPVSSRNAYGEYAFYKIADASKDLEAVFHAFKAIIADSQPEAAKTLKKPMSAENLHFLGEKIRNLDLRNCIFNQPVYFIGEQVPSIEFLEFFVSTKQIEENFLPDISLTGSPWLFNALKEDLDRATLRTMAREIPEYRHKAFSVNLTLNTASSKEFAQFNEALPGRLAGRIVIEVHKTDVVQHLDLYRQVRKTTEKLGLKLCIDGVEWQDFDVLSLGRLRPDFVKIGWSESMLSPSEEGLQSLVGGLKGLNGHGQAVLTRCDNPKAFPFARGLGIRFVQGRLADQFFKSGMKLQ